MEPPSLFHLLKTFIFVSIFKETFIRLTVVKLNKVPKARITCKSCFWVNNSLQANGLQNSYTLGHIRNVMNTEVRKK